MKRFSAAMVGTLLAGAACADATVTSVTARQDWPWSRAVNVQVVVEGADDAGVNLSVKAYDGETDLGAVPSAALTSGSLLGAKNGTHRFAFDPSVAFPNAGANGFDAFRVEVDVAGAADPLLDRVEYRILDLEAPYAVKDLTRRDFYEHPGLYGAFTTDYSTVGPGFVSALGENETFVWTGVNSNDVYKTTKLVLKRIPAKDVVWTMGPVEGDTNAKAADSWSYPELGESRVEVMLSKDYFMGVFEVTQRQYELLTGGENPSFFTNIAVQATRPVESIELSHQNFVTKIASVHDFRLKVPTEAQWEFAARAGYEGTGLPNGKEYSTANHTELEGYGASRGHTDRNADSGTYKVGVGRPNAFGLFNMLGNITEWVAEEPRTNLSSYYASKNKPVADPQTTSADGMFGATYGTLKGGNFNRLWWRYAARLATPDGQAIQWSQPLWGWRVCMDAE